MEEKKHPVRITIETEIRLPVDRVWELWTGPEHIVRWNAASPDWHTTAATNDLREGGRFSFRMEARDGSAGFDFGGTYHHVIPGQIFGYTMGDGREAEVRFSVAGGVTRITETFEAENVNPPELQKAGWQAILDHFRSYAEGSV
jgi:uncharacterized protein YndB with AHSA1/START domain